MSDEDQGHETEYEDSSYFMGICTCMHDSELHTWGHCGVEGCDCEAGWEE